MHPIPDQPLHPVVPVVGSPVGWPVRRILCVGRNYRAHASEMGADTREPPFFFAKSFDAAFVCNADGIGHMAMPDRTENLHHEVEHMVALGAGGRHLTPEQAASLVAAQGVAVDMTRRDVQDEAKRTSRPWMTSKDFDGGAILGPLVRVGEQGAFEKGAISLQVSGKLRQSGDLSERIWRVGELLSALSGWLTLHPGDLVLTGTPAGVGPVRSNQKIYAQIEGLPPIFVNIVRPRRPRNPRNPGHDGASEPG